MTKHKSLFKKILFIIFPLLGLSFSKRAKRINALCNKNNRWVYLYDMPNYIGDLVNVIGGEQDEPFHTLRVNDNPFSPPI